MFIVVPARNQPVDLANNSIGQSSQTTFTNSAAGMAGALAGWAIASIGKKACCFLVE